MKYHEFDLTEAQGNEYVLSETVDAYFIETDQDYDLVEIFTWAEEEKITLQKDEQIIIDDIGEYEQFQVQLSDGRVGILYFWIGD